MPISKTCKIDMCRESNCAHVFLNSDSKLFGMYLKFLPPKNVEYLRDGDTCGKETPLSDDSARDPCRTILKSQIYVNAQLGLRSHGWGAFLKFTPTELTLRLPPNGHAQNVGERAVPVWPLPRDAKHHRMVRYVSGACLGSWWILPLTRRKNLIIAPRAHRGCLFLNYQGPSKF